MRKACQQGSNFKQNFYSFWISHSWKETVVPVCCNNEGLNNIELGVNSGYSFLVGSLWHQFITKRDKYYQKVSYSITNYDNSLLQNASSFLLQNAKVLVQSVHKCDDFITKSNSYCKIRQYRRNNILLHRCLIA